MRKTYTLLSLIFAFAFSVNAQHLVITNVVVGDCGNSSKFVEIYIDGSIDLSQYKLVRRSNSGTWADNGVDIALTDFGTRTNEFIYLIRDLATLNTEFPNVDITTNNSMVNGSISHNGNDSYRIVEVSSNTVIDQFGGDTDGTGESWEYIKSWVSRNDDVGPNPNFNESEWTFHGLNVLEGEGICKNSDPLEDIVNTLASYNNSSFTGGADYAYNNGSWIPENPENGVSDDTDEVLIMNGTATLNEDTYMNKLTVNSGAKLVVNKVLYLTNELNNEGNITFASSSATSTGMLGAVASGFQNTGTGEVTIERFIPANRAFRLLSTAVNTSTTIRDNWQEGVNNSGTDFTQDNLNPNPGYGTHITGSTTGANGFDASISGNPSLFGFDNMSGSWEDIENTDVNTLTAGTPYRLFVRGSRATDLSDNSSTPTATILRTTGQLVTGNVTTDVSNDAGAFNLVGNPYQSSVDMNTLIANSNNINDGYYYIFDPNIGEQGAYVTILLPSGASSPTDTGVSGTSAANQYLQPGQAAFVRTLDNAPGTQVIFEENSKAPAQLTDTFRPAQDPDESLFIYGQLFTEQNILANDLANDSFWLRFSENYSNEKTMQDALKLFNADENIGSLTDNEVFSIENREMPYEMEEIPLYSNNYTAENYSLRLNVSDFGELQPYLKDNFTNELIALSSGENEISFVVNPNDESSTNQRFSIVFQNSNLHTATFDKNNLLVYPNPVNNSSVFVQLTNSNLGACTIKAYTILGQEVYSSTLSFTQRKRLEIKEAAHWETGVYMLRITNAKKTYTTKIIIN